MVLGTPVLLAIFTLIAIKNLVSLLLYSLGVSKYDCKKRRTLIDEILSVTNVSRKSLVFSFVLDFLEICLLFFLFYLFPSPLVSAAISLAVVNFFTKWLVIVAIRKYITSQFKKAVAAYFSIRFEIFKEVVCILLYLMYFMTYT